MVGGSLAVQSYFDHRRATAFDRALVDTASQLNAKLPMQVDQYTRLDSTAPGPGRRFTYMYTLSGFPEGVTPSDAAAALRPSLVNAYKTIPQMAIFRDNGVEMHYIYRDTSGKYVAEIVVSPKDLQ
jgi:hypothetical protein